MRDHECLAAQRLRMRISSAERISARSSGATLIQGSTSPLARQSAEADPVEALPPMPERDERMGSIQETPKSKTHARHMSLPNLISNEVPPAELRGLKRRSWDVKALVKKLMVKKDGKTLDSATETNDEVPQQKGRRVALSTKNRNALLRPSTATPTAKPVNPDPFTTSTTSVPVPQSVWPPIERRHTPRYYAQESKAKDEERPNTAAKEQKSEDDAARSVKRRSWGAANKLKRRSLF